MTIGIDLYLADHLVLSDLTAYENDCWFGRIETNGMVAVLAGVDIITIPSLVVEKVVVILGVGKPKDVRINDGVPLRIQRVSGDCGCFLHLVRSVYPIGGFDDGPIDGNTKVLIGRRCEEEIASLHAWR